MAGIIGIYGLVVSVLISDGLKQDVALYTSFIQLGAGLSVGLAGLAAGYVPPPSSQPLSLEIARPPLPCSYHQTFSYALTLLLFKLRHRHCRRRWCPWHRPTTPPLRRHDPHPHLRGGVGALRAYRRASDELKGDAGCKLQSAYVSFVGAAVGGWAVYGGRGYWHCSLKQAYDKGEGTAV